MTEASQGRDALKDTAPAWNTCQRYTEKGDSAGDTWAEPGSHHLQRSVKMHSGECGVSPTGLGS